MGSKGQRFFMKFSIITPIYGDTYKNLPYYFTCLKNQTFKDFEVILVFDGPNKGLKVAEELFKKYKFEGEIIIREFHEGACAARNAGAKQAKGKYFAFPGGDCYLAPSALQEWYDAFEKNPKINRIWGKYNIYDGLETYTIGMAPSDNNKVLYEAFKYSNYCDGTFPVRKTAFTLWDESLKSLNDWEWVVGQLSKTNFKGDDFLFIDKVFFEAEMPKIGGLSYDSRENFIQRAKYIKEKHKIPTYDKVVGTVNIDKKALEFSKKIKAEFVPNPSYREHRYKQVYSYGFNCKSDYSAMANTKIFNLPGDYERIIIWRDEDVKDFRDYPARLTLIEYFLKNKIKHIYRKPKLLNILGVKNVKERE